MATRRLTIWTLLVFTAILCLGLCALAKLAWAGAGARMYVVNTLSRDLSVIDLAGESALPVIPLNARGYRIAFSPDGARAYVTTAPAPGNADSSGRQTGLAVVELGSRQVSHLALDINPLATVHVLPHGRQALVVTAAAPGKRNSERGRVLFVDLPDGKVRRVVPIGLNPLDSALSPAGDMLYTLDWASQAISVVEVAGGRLRDTIPLGGYPAHMLAMAPDGSALYTAVGPSLAQTANATQQAIPQNAQTSPQTNVQSDARQQICEIDTRTDALRRFPAGGLHTVTALAVTPDGKKLYACGHSQAPATSSQRPDYQLVVIDRHSRSLLNQFPLRDSLSTLLCSPDGKQLYLIGTPGDPAKEARLQRTLAKNPINNQLMPTMSNAGLNVAQTTSAGLLNDLSHLPKTLTILDAATGHTLKTLPLGSLPQGCGVVGR